jgi:hypothetical protein
MVIPDMSPLAEATAMGFQSTLLTSIPELLHRRAVKASVQSAALLVVMRKGERGSRPSAAPVGGAAGPRAPSVFSSVTC